MRWFFESLHSFLAVSNMIPSLSSDDFIYLFMTNFRGYSYKFCCYKEAFAPTSYYSRTFSHWFLHWKLLLWGGILKPPDLFTERSVLWSKLEQFDPPQWKGSYRWFHRLFSFFSFAPGALIVHEEKGVAVCRILPLPWVVTLHDKPSFIHPILGSQKLGVLFKMVTSWCDVVATAKSPPIGTSVQIWGIRLVIVL